MFLIHRVLPTLEVRVGEKDLIPLKTRWGAFALCKSSSATENHGDLGAGTVVLRAGGAVETTFLRASTPRLPNKTHELKPRL